MSYAETADARDLRTQAHVGEASRPWHRERARLDRDARENGAAKVIGRRVTTNVDMRALCAKLGFIELGTLIETTTCLDQPHLYPFMH